MSIYETETSPTLEQGSGAGGNNVPMIVAYGFEPGVAKRLNVESRFYEECCPTLRENAGDNQASVVVIGDEEHGGCNKR